MIGLGLNDSKDITIKGLEAVKKADVVYLESYTSKLSTKFPELEQFYNKKIIVASREIVESQAEQTILKDAKAKETVFLVVGDVFSATTHTDLYLRARKLAIKVHVIHNASVLTAVGATGLQLYKFGKVASIPFLNENVEAPYDVLKINMQNNLHTLFLLDLKENETVSLSVNDAVRYLLRTEIKRGERLFSDHTLCIGCAGLGSEDQIIKMGSAKDLIRHQFGQGMQCLIVPGKNLHFMEEEMLRLYK